LGGKGNDRWEWNMRKEVREHGRSKRKEKMREQKIDWKRRRKGRV
jgi:hypothetical protein